jgi:molybdate transport system substrate-binding protein
MKKILFALSVFAIFSSTLLAEDIKVATAANVGAVLDDLKKEFAKIRPNDKIDATLGASGKFAAQIEQGAPFQVFVSADTELPAKLKKSGYVIGEPKVYATGILAMLSTKGVDVSKGLSVLASDSVKKIAIANPKTAPYGTAAIEAMQKTGVYSKVASKIVQGESITQAYQYAVTAADVGFVALSSLKVGDGLKYKEGVNWIVVDDKLYEPIDQAIALLKNGENSDGAKAFVTFMTSKEAKAIFAKYGYK